MNKIINILSILCGVMIVTVYTKPFASLAVATAVAAIIVLAL